MFNYVCAPVVKYRPMSRPSTLYFERQSYLMEDEVIGIENINKILYAI